MSLLIQTFRLGRLLIEEVANRQKQRAALSISKRYEGYGKGVLEKMHESMRRAFYIIKECSVKKGLDVYDFQLRSRSKILAFANYSVQPVPNFEIKIMPILI